ncbi:MAG: hypothetical protein Q8R54_01955, partial [Methylobacter sp.]|nr:hypothetical protein [Methylobacter sp.]
MTFLFTVLAIAPGYYQFKQHRDNLKTFINQLLHWVGGLCAVIIIYAYHSSGRIFHEEAGLIVLLILALTTYLDGIKKDWRCIFVGLFLGLITVCVAYFDSYIWQLIVLAAAPLLTVITTLMNKPIGKGSLLFCLTGIVTMEFKVLLLSLLLSANSFAAEKTVIRI